jgi:hypothetical protein
MDIGWKQGRIILFNALIEHQIAKSLLPQKITIMSNTYEKFIKKHFFSFFRFKNCITGSTGPRCESCDYDNKQSNGAYGKLDKWLCSHCNPA